MFLPLAKHGPWALALSKAFARLRQTHSQPDRPTPQGPPSLTNTETPDTAPGRQADLIQN